MPIIDVVVVVHPEDATDVTVYLDGVATTSTTRGVRVYVIKPDGKSAKEWADERAEMTATASRAAADQIGTAFDSYAGSEWVDGL